MRLFAPQGAKELAPVVLLVEEYEAIRIVDLEKRTHDQCAQQMQISRTTATEIYEKARFKIADAIVNGKPLVIEGGNYRICQETNCCACAGRCRRKTVAQSAAQDEIQGVSHMKIALPVKNDAIFQHFGMAPNFKIYEVQDGHIVSTETIAASGHGHAAVVNLLVKNAVDCVICGGLGPGAVKSLAQANIALYAGNEGDCDIAIAALIAGRFRTTLKPRPPAEAATIVMVMKKADADAMDIMDTKKKAAAVTDTEKRVNAAAAANVRAAKKHATATTKTTIAVATVMVTDTAVAANTDFGC